MNYWEYLNVFDKNLIYMYIKSLKEKSTIFKNIANCNISESINAENKKKIGFYILWFVYRYILKCKTYKEALHYVTKDIIKKYKLDTIIKQRILFIGIYGMDEIYLYKIEDIKIALEIIYGKYNLFKQLQCYIEHTNGTARTSRNKCLKLIDKYTKIKEKRG